MTENLTDTNVGNIEYIRREDAITEICDCTCGELKDVCKSQEGCSYYEALKLLPSADVVQVVHGKWIDEDPAFAEYFANCSVCGYEIDVHNERGYFNFCPNCGAKMDGEE